jgi:hypothetical protein
VVLALFVSEEELDLESEPEEPESDELDPDEPDPDEPSLFLLSEFSRARLRVP